MTLEAKKLHILSKILSINSPATLKRIDEAIHKIEEENTDSLEDIKFHIGHIEDTVDINKISKEQEVSPLSMEELDQLIIEADFSEDIEELLLALD